MNYKTKLFVVLVGLTFVTNGILFAIFYNGAYTILRNQINAKVLSIVTTAAATINGDELAELNKTRDMNSPLFKKYELTFRKIRNANRRSDTYVKYFYMVFADPANPNNLLYGVDAEEPGEFKSKIGDPYQITSTQPFILNQVGVQDNFVVNRLGKWYQAHAPLYDSKGKLVGAVVLNIRNDVMLMRLEPLLRAGYLALGLSILFALLLAYLLAKRTTRSLDIIGHALHKIGKGDLSTNVFIKTKDEFAKVGDAINDMVMGLRQRDNLKMSLARYVSNQVAEKIIETGKLPEVQGERRKITVLFCDVRNFTALAENLAPEEVVGLLNEAFEVMIDAVFKYQGMLDKFLGDGFMAIFGAPLDDNMQEEHAIYAALAMQNALIGLAEKWHQERGIHFRMGIGIHTGIAIVGNIGSKQRMEYTAIGDTVNLAARLESATKELDTRILISETTYKAVINKFVFQSRGVIHVKGRQELVTVYEVKERMSA